MASNSELKQLRKYYEEKIEYLNYLINNETYYCPEEKKYKQEVYKIEIKDLKVSISTINEDLKEERKYTPGRVKIKKNTRTKVKTTKSRSKSKKRSVSPTLSESIEIIRKDFPRVKKTLSSRPKSSKTKVKKSKSRGRSKSRSK